MEGMTMRRVLMLVAVLWGMAAGPVAAEATRALPPPDWDHPRKILLQVTSDDPHKFAAVLSNLAAIQAFYGLDNVKLAVLTWAGGVRALLRESAQDGARVASQQLSGVEFLACGNTLSTWHKEAGDLLPGVTVVPAGIPEAVERQLSGWIVVTP